MQARTIAVIGAGIVGVSIAEWLRRDGHQVTLIDRNDPGSPDQASYGNAGVLAASSFIPVPVPGLLAKSCPLDLAKWPVGMSQASHFLHIGCTWYRRSETGFDLYIGRSFARSAAEWLIESAAEFGVEILAPNT